jgi:hypothetical protein
MAVALRIQERYFDAVLGPDGLGVSSQEYFICYARVSTTGGKRLVGAKFQADVSSEDSDKTESALLPL